MATSGKSAKNVKAAAKKKVRKVDKTASVYATGSGKPKKGY